MNKTVILLSTYDDGKDLWDGFFMCLEKQWPNCDLDIYMNTETMSYSRQNLNIRCINTRKGLPWSKRLKMVLRQIDAEYILLFLEDYWIDKVVNPEKVIQAIQWLDANKDVASFSFYPCMKGHNIDDNRFPGFELRPQNCDYKLNCQVGLWRRKKLISFLRSHESAWDFEILGSIRARRYKEKFYSISSYEDIPFSYGDPELGCLVKKGKYVQSRVKELENLYNITIDTSKRGIYEESQIIKSSKRFASLKDMLQRAIKRIRSLI